MGRSQFISTMSGVLLPGILANGPKIEGRLAEVRAKLAEIRKVRIDEYIRQLTAENNSLETQVQRAKSELIRLETQNGRKQIPIPTNGEKHVQDEDRRRLTEVNEAKPNEVENAGKKEAKAKKEKPSAKIVPADAGIDISRLDLRVGKIIEVNKHPDADSLYIEKIDCGEEKPRTVVSGLVKHVPIDEMKDSIVMVLCNLKPVKMRGVTSEAMVMCASSPEKVELLIAPAGSVPGDPVHCAGYPRNPDGQLNPKKKVFETCAPDLKTDDSAVACYRGTPLEIPGKGYVVAKTLKGAFVK